MTGESKRLLFLVSEDWYFLSHRLYLALAARDAGYQVAVATRLSGHGAKFERHGLQIFPLSLQRDSRNPLRELAALWEIIGIYRCFRPDIAHHVSLKPSLYGSVAALLVRVPVVINALAGLGYVFTSSDTYARVLRPLILAAFRLLFCRGNTRVIFQNSDDRQMMIDLGAVTLDNTVLIRGSGVELEVFRPVPLPEGMPLVVFAARMLWDKGLHEFVEAVRLLKRAGSSARFILVGEPDPHNPESANEADLRRWVNEGLVEWWGRRNDMPTVLGEATIVCLPSYREGLPKVLLEAAACARPIVATDVAGCREIVISGLNGILVPPRDPVALARAVAELLSDPEMCSRLGVAGRELVEEHFSSGKVAQETLVVYRDMLARVCAHSG